MSHCCRTPGTILLLAASLLAGGCNPKREVAPAPWLSPPEVARPEAPPAESMAADIFVDATLSMTGYVADPDSVYVQLLDELEGSLANKWKKSADLRYYKFGKSVRQVQRDEFRKARNVGFYKEKGIFETTEIELVASRANPTRLTVVVTDLFQGDGDVNTIVHTIRTNVFDKNLSVGVLAIGSEFDGKVFDARVPPFRYTSRKGAPATFRPFYLLMFGDPATIEQLVAALAARPFVDRSHFLLVSPQIVRAYQVRVVKHPNAKGLKTRAATGDPDDFPFDVRDDARGGALDAEIRLQLNPNAAPFRTEALDLLAHQTAKPGDASHDVTLQGVTRNGDVLQASLLLDSAAPPGKYAYDLLLRAGGPGGWTAPGWVEERSSDNPTPDKDANRTLNLRRLVMELVDAEASIHRPALAKLRLSVRKQR